MILPDNAIIHARFRYLFSAPRATRIVDATSLTGYNTDEFNLYWRVSLLTPSLDDGKPEISSIIKPSLHQNHK
jgi:hypothetical protein